MRVCPTCGQENPDIARFCLACATPLSDAGGLPAEERKIVSVLFCDLVGFTAQSDQADPEDVRARLRPYHVRVRQEIERFGGTMEKFIGDAVMAVFGAPVAHEDDAERAVRAGLRILEAIQEMNRSQPGLNLAVRIGINTGEAVVSLAPSRLGEESIAVGDVINTASRLQSIAPSSGVVVGEATYGTTRDLFEFEELDPATLKGKGKPVRVWRARAPRRDVRSYPEPFGLLPFFDREDELDLLARTLARAVRDRSVQVVTLVGEPGVGKTRLVREFSAWARAPEDAVTWRYGRCLPYGEGVTFWALGEVVKAQAGILESDTPDEALRKLSAAVEALLEDTLEQEWVRMRIAPLVGITYAEGGAPERSETYAAWRRFLESMAATGPLALIFEDLHWADRAMLEFVEDLADWSTDVPMLVVCTARPELFERQSGWGGGMRNATTISLSPLGDEQIRGLVSALLPDRGSDRALQDLVLERAGGNPLYAEEFARMLADRELASDRTADGSNAFPESIHAIIAARLDTLAPDLKALLQDASVVGRVFWSGAVASLSGVDEAAVRDHLHALARKDLVRPTRDSVIKDQAQYTFWHALIRDVAYTQIPRSARARKHRQMAEWTVATSGERVADHAELVAHHFRQTLDLATATGDTAQVPDLQELTARYLEMAGDRALGLDARRALDHFAAAVALLPAGSERRTPLMVRAAEAAARVGRFEEAERTYEEAIHALERADNQRAAGGAMVKLSNLFWHMGETAKSRETLNEAMAILEKEDPGPELAGAYAAQAEDKVILGLYDEALQWAKQALSLMEMLDAKDDAPRALSAQGMARWYMGDATGVDDLRDALELATTLGLGRDAARLQAILGEFLWVTEGPEVGLAAIDEATELAARRGNDDLAMACRAERFGPLLDLGQWDELLRAADELAAWSRTSGEGYFTIAAAVSRARVRLYRGEVDLAVEEAGRFLPAARQIEDPQVLVQALAVAAHIEQAAGRPDEAVGLVEEFQRVTTARPTWFGAKEIPELVRTCVAVGVTDMADRLFEGLPIHARRHQLSVLTAKAVLQESAGNDEAAFDAYVRAADGWVDFGHRLESGLTALGAGRCLVRLGRPGAGERLTVARSTFLALRAGPLMKETDGWLARAPAQIL